MYLPVWTQVDTLDRIKPNLVEHIHDRVWTQINKSITWGIHVYDLRHPALAALRD